MRAHGWQRSRLALRGTATAVCACSAVYAHVWHNPSFSLGTVHGPTLDSVTGNALIALWLREALAGTRSAFLVSRLGLGGELSACVDALLGRPFSDLTSLTANAGVYPATDAPSFTEGYLASLNSSSIIGRFGQIRRDQEHFVLERCCQRAIVVANRALEPYFFQSPWSRELASRIVLVVHPFTATIRRQYAKNVSLWLDPDVLPRFELKLVQSPLTLADAPKPHTSWSDSLRHLQARVSAAAPFDVALLGCGAYGLPLAHYIVNEHNVPALYMGGALQLLFGIKGRRWADRPDFRAFFNSHWVWPDAAETPPGASRVENGAYWR